MADFRRRRRRGGHRASRAECSIYSPWDRVQPNRQHRPCSSCRAVGQPELAVRSRYRASLASASGLSAPPLYFNALDPAWRHHACRSHLPGTDRTPSMPAWQRRVKPAKLSFFGGLGWRRLAARHRGLLRLELARIDDRGLASPGGRGRCRSWRGGPFPAGWRSLARLAWRQSGLRAVPDEPHSPES